MIIAGDIGGTKALFMLAQAEGGRPLALLERRYEVAYFAGFSGLLARFVEECRELHGPGLRIASACFGVAGPVSGGRVDMTNLAWTLDATAIAGEFDIGRVQLVNDFAAAATGVNALGEGDCSLLQCGEPLAEAARVVIGAGSGLGIAYLAPGGAGLVIAGEGGHASFAPANEEQMRLWKALHAEFGHVCVEHVVSGPGLVRIFEFLRGSEPASPELEAAVRAEGAAAVSRFALDHADPLACRALDLFIDCYGAIAGDHALAVTARAGVFVAGGIATKILRRLAAGGFIRAFNAKGGYARLAAKMPVRVVTTERLGLIGAALIALKA